MGIVDGDYFGGQLDEVVLYSRAISADVIGNVSIDYNDLPVWEGGIGQQTPTSVELTLVSAGASFTNVLLLIGALLLVTGVAWRWRDRTGL